MIRRAMVPGVLLVLGLHPSLFGEIINVPGDQPSIQAAIDAAADGDEIIVAPGTYFENINLLGKAVTLRSSSGPDVTTIDAGGNGTVVTCDSGEGSDTVIDGFTITGGNATSEYPDNRGGGMHIKESSPTVTNCIFTGNSATFGGGMDNFDSSPTVTGCTFTGNMAERGGGMFSHGSSSMVTDCTFSGNSAVGLVAEGGGMSISGGSPSAIDCTFIGNTARNGGGMAISGNGTPLVVNCSFTQNTACTEDECGVGGGVFNHSSNSTFVNCMFLGNTALGTFGNGGGIKNHNHGRTLILINCLFAGNSSGFGGGLSGVHNAIAVVINCTFVGNAATSQNPNYGGGAISGFGAPMTVINSILWGNSAVGSGPQIFTDTTITLMHSDVQGGPADFGGDGPFIWFPSNIDADPLFVDSDGADNDPDTFDDNDYRLAAGSPSIDAADNASVPADVTTDLDGNPRFVDGDEDGVVVVDMGAYEFGPADPCEDDDGDGQVTICHIPPGNPDNAHTITVSVNAVPAHLAHGDHCGPCEQDGGLLNVGSSALTANPCQADFDNDGAVGPFDLGFVLGFWGPNPDHPADLDGDGVVGSMDLAIVLGGWGPCP